MTTRISNLTKADAQIRTNSEMTNIQYNCYLNLYNNEEDKYNGLIEVRFDINKIDKVFINYCGKTIETLFVNGKQIELTEAFLKENWVESNLYLPKDLIKNKENIVEIKFSNHYSKDGDGLCLTFGSDKLKYKYTQTEPYGLNRIFPVFDQPDLKGKIKYYFTASEEDEVITTEFFEKHFKSYEEIKVEELDNFGKRVYESFGANLKNLWIFGNSKHLSSYLFGFSVGPFQEFKLDLSKFERGIPISIFCRKSVAKYMEKQIEDIFYPMKEGILIYEEFFGIKYPFTKNDLIFLPEYKVGAMEYPGCITINEIYVFQDKVIPPLRTLTRSHTIYHELAHMWFGNLVTMKWWDDLWLNESFAELISVMVMKFTKDPPNTINYDTDIMLRLDWGLKTDEKKSTHPISCDIIDTAMSESIFDGISYSKGPGVLKQLVYNIGLDKFKENLRNYFQKYQWKNTDLVMFLEEMGSGINYDIKEFNEDFIQKSCLNKLTLTRKDNGININQSFVLEEYNYLRNHKVMVAFFDENCELIKIEDVFVKKQENTFVELDKDLLKKSKAIFINYNFNAWVRFNLDNESNDFILNNIAKFKKYSLNLRNFMSNYYNLVRESKIKSTEYLNRMIDNLENIVDDQVMLSDVLPCCLGAISYYMPKELKEEYYTKLNNKLMMFLKKEKNPVISSKLYDYYFSTCFTNQSILSLKVILDGNFCNKNLDLKSRDKWSIYFKLVASGLLDSNFENSYLKLITEGDDTDEKTKILTRIKAFKSNEKERKELFEIYKDGKSEVLNYQEKLISISGFKSSFIPEKIRYDYYDEYFNNILYVFRTYGFQSGEYYLLSLYPGNYRIEESINRLEKVISETKEDEASYRREIISQLEDSKRILTHLNLFKN